MSNFTTFHIVFYSFLLLSVLEMSGSYFCQSANSFAVRLHKALSSSNGNVFSCPLSAYVTLAYLSHGSDGTTRSKLTKALNYQQSDSELNELRQFFSSINNLSDLDLEIISRIFINNEVFEDFLSLGRQYYNCEAEVIESFGKDTAKKINAWVSDKTKRRIKNVISEDDFDEDTKLVLLNAVHFKGKWQKEFKSEDTEAKTFHSDPPMKVLTMFHKSKYNYAEILALKSELIEIPYSSGFDMTIILPNEPNGLSALEEEFDWQVISQVPRTSETIELYLPKFKVEASVDLEKVAAKIGIESIFDLTANFSKLSEDLLRVSKFVQKVFVEVNEEGSEAAAATVGLLRVRKMADFPKVFSVDRPFMFVIRSVVTNLILFIGSVRELESAGKDEL